ncbi:hypothetical protein PENSPDRAFT_694530 [Peniophora sp. CONT]|nr:hypothetical protein PENSPDRAFT_694530 [Peniophora sp. CONT]
MSVDSDSEMGSIVDLPGPPPEFMNAIARPPPGVTFSPALTDAWLDHIRAQVAPMATDGGEEVEYFAITNGAHGPRIANAAEAEADVVGHPGAARRRFFDLGHAQHYLDLYGFAKTAHSIPRHAIELRDERDGFSETSTRLSLTNDQATILDQPEYTAPYKYTVEVTPRPHAMPVASPMELDAIVGNHHVHIAFEPRAPEPDHTLAFPIRADARGTRIDLSAQQGVPVYSSTPGVPPVVGERNGDVFSRVLPHATLVVEDGRTFSQDDALTPIVPLPYQPRKDKDLYWVVVQGWRVGIFKAPAQNIRKLLPSGFSVAKGFYTLEEASMFWHLELELGWKLAEVVGAPPVEQLVEQALVAGAPANPELAEALLGELHN